MTIDQARRTLGGKFWFRRFRRGYFKVECAYEGCSASWSVSGKGLDHPGNVLSLLNHYAGHERPEEEKKRALREAHRRTISKLNAALTGSL